jgi:predicted aspartyl protease
MGLTFVELETAHPGTLEKWIAVQCLVDSGAVYSVIAAPLLEELGIKPIDTNSYTLADGTIIERKKGIAAFRIGERIGGADVIFGEDGDANLVGALTLEALGLSLDPLRRELKPLPMMLAQQDERSD